MCVNDNYQPPYKFAECVCHHVYLSQLIFINQKHLPNGELYQMEYCKVLCGFHSHSNVMACYHENESDARIQLVHISTQWWFLQMSQKHWLTHNPCNVKSQKTTLQAILCQENDTTAHFIQCFFCFNVRLVLSASGGFATLSTDFDDLSFGCYKHDTPLRSLYS